MREQIFFFHLRSGGIVPREQIYSKDVTRESNSVVGKGVAKLLFERLSLEF